MASGWIDPGAESRATQSSIRASAAAKSRRSSASSASGATSTLAMTVARLYRLSSTSSVSVTIMTASGRARSSGGASGSDSIVRTMSYPRYPTAPPVKRGSPGHVDRRMPAEEAAEMLERRHVRLDLPPTGGTGPAGTRPPVVAEDFAGIGGEKGVSRPPLPALERLQQEAVRPAVELGERGDRRVAIEDDLAGHGNHRAALAGARGERVEGGGHGAAATT